MYSTNYMHYNTIAKAIQYVQEHYQKQPELEDIARHVHMSPFHFQKVFQEWAGISPKKFLQHVSLQHAKKLLRRDQLSLFDTTLALGMSGTGRLHDLFVQIEHMTPAEYKNGGKDLAITYNFFSSKFGTILMAATGKGICFLHFQDADPDLNPLLKEFPRATLIQGDIPHFEQAVACIHGMLPGKKINLHLKGTPFQLKVWHALLGIDEGNTKTYAEIASQIGSGGASRSVGTAIGQNPVAYLIPCHRVIRSDGSLGGYMWGLTRKSAILSIENFTK